jgi:hypothetical protein
VSTLHEALTLVEILLTVSELDAISKTEVGRLGDIPAGPNSTKIGEPGRDRVFDVIDGRVFSPQSKDVFERSGSKAVQPRVGRGNEAFKGASTGTAQGQKLLSFRKRELETDSSRGMLAALTAVSAAAAVRVKKTKFIISTRIKGLKQR